MYIHIYIIDIQGRHSNQCHHAMARVDFLPRKFASKDCLQASLVIYYISLGSGTGCLYCRLAPLIILNLSFAVIENKWKWFFKSLQNIKYLNVFVFLHFKNKFFVSQNWRNITWIWLIWKPNAMKFLLIGVILQVFFNANFF